MNFATALLFSLAVVGFAQAQPVQRDLGVVNLRVSTGAPGERLYGESHALVIGSSRYTAGWSHLPGVSADVEAVGALLKRHGFKVQTLLNPTRSQLDEGLRGFANTYGLNPANRLLVYYAGHGHTITTSFGKKLGYIVPVDAPRPDRDDAGFRRMAYGMENFEQLSRQIEAKHVMFLFDSCFSGTVFRTRSGVPDSISDKTAKPVRIFITAGDENQPVPDESIFRRQLERALGPDAEADLNKDGYITGTELGSFLEDQVTNYSRRSQTPRWGKLNDPDLDRGDLVFTSPRPSATDYGTYSSSVVASRIAPSGSTGGSSLDDLKREQATRDQWTNWQLRMKQDFDDVAKFGGAKDLQVTAWERFLAAWSQDNPFSTEAQLLRMEAERRLSTLKRGPTQTSEGSRPGGQVADQPRQQAGDRRTAGARLDDEGIERRFAARLREQLGDRSHINLVSFNRAVLVTGELINAEERPRLIEAAKYMDGVRTVFLEATVMPLSSLASRSSDALIGAKVKSSLADRDVRAAQAVRVVVERGVVYLMGLVTQKEADGVTAVVREISGVQKVVKFFEIVSDEARARL